VSDHDGEHSKYLVPGIVLGAVVVIVPLVWLAISMSSGPSDGSGGSGGGFSLGGGSSSVDSQARIELEMIRQRIDALEQAVVDLRQEVASGAMGLGVAPPEAPDDFFRGDGPNTIIDSYASVVLIPGRLEVNEGLTLATPSFLVETFGRPREVLSDDCEPMTNPTLSQLLVTEDVGPVRVQMLRPAAESIRAVFARVQQVDQDLYDRINTSGSLCVRRVRGSQDSVSNHSFGLAIDLNIDGQLDNFTDGKTQLGLTILADFFKEEGWIWGAGFRREDSMHFEVSRDLLERWRSEGLI
jgi:hypothetical protein